MRECIASINQAWASSPGQFGDLSIITVPDHKGALGRSAARNQGLQLAKTDWVLLIDADDLLFPWAFSELPPLIHTAYWGQICIELGVYMRDRFPCNWHTLMEHGAAGTLSMGCFVRTSAALETLFLEPLDAGEDFEFYLALCSKFSFWKVRKPLVRARVNQPSAGGPRGYRTLDWKAACEPIIDWWRARGRAPATRQERLTAFADEKASS